MNLKMTAMESTVGSLIPNMIVFGDGALGTELGLDEFLRVGPHDAISVLIRDIRELAFSLTHSLPCKDTQRRLPTESQEESPHPGTQLDNTFILDSPAT